MLLLTGASYNIASQRVPIIQPSSYDIPMSDNSTNYFVLCQPDNSYQTIPHQPYQLAPSHHVYQYVGEKEIY